LARVKINDPFKDLNNTLLHMDRAFVGETHSLPRRVKYHRVHSGFWVKKIPESNLFSSSTHTGRRAAAPPQQSQTTNLSHHDPEGGGERINWSFGISDCNKCSSLVEKGVVHQVEELQKTK
jgi:hypothetical protein